MKQKSILFLTNAYPDFESSYRGVFIKKMALCLMEVGYRISVVTPKIYRRSPCFEKQDNILVYRFPFFAGDKLLIEHKNIPYFRMVIYYLTGLFLGAYATLTNQCDLIHVHWAIPTGPIGIILGTLVRKPVIVTVHGSDLRMALEGSPVLKRIFVWVCKRAWHIHVVSEKMRSHIEKSGIPQEKISVWPMGIDETFLQSGKNRKKRSDGCPVTVVSTRNLLPIYDVSCLIRAIPLILKEELGARFLIAGEGSERENLEREARKLDVRVRSSLQFVGRVAHDQMPTLLAQADIYISTSLADGTSVSLMEALAAGAFPVVTDIPANREWITDGVNGFLVPVGNERKLADRVIEAIRNTALLERAIEMNQVHVMEKANWEANIPRMRAVYAGVLKA